MISSKVPAENALLRASYSTTCVFLWDTTSPIESTLEEDDEGDYNDNDDEAVDDDEDHVDASSAATAPDVGYARRTEELSCARLCNHAWN